MPRTERVRSKSGCYHIMLRGNERKEIFIDDDDKKRFLETLGRVKRENIFYLYAFCLMSNHVHLLIKENQEDIASVMRSICISYAAYFNKKYERVGHLFQDRFKSENIEDDRYILTLIRYIHRNPVKAKLAEACNDYAWSSCNAYTGDNLFSGILDTDFILGILSEDREMAIKIYKEYMLQDSQDSFMDIDNENTMDITSARLLYMNMLNTYGFGVSGKNMPYLPDTFIREYKQKTGLSARKISQITEQNKDRVCKILNSKVKDIDISLCRGTSLLSIKKPILP